MEGRMFASQNAEIESAFIACRGPLERYLTALVRDPEAAQDLAQEAFLRLAREIDAGRRPDNPAAWLHRVATNLAMSRGRHLQVADRRVADLVERGQVSSPEVETVGGELQAAVVRLVAELPLPERVALVLASQGYGGSEIATRVGRTPGATRTLLCRTRAKLRRGLALAGFAVP
jgi:RNA polymerase sigma-70 factor (ECF subfamily)